MLLGSRTVVKFFYRTRSGELVLPFIDRVYLPILDFKGLMHKTTETLPGSMVVFQHLENDHRADQFSHRALISESKMNILNCKFFATPRHIDLPSYCQAINASIPCNFLLRGLKKTWRKCSVDTVPVIHGACYGVQGDFIVANKRKFKIDTLRICIPSVRKTLFTILVTDIYISYLFVALIKLIWIHFEKLYCPFMLLNL